jgi:hypothetical protein
LRIRVVAGISLESYVIPVTLYPVLRILVMAIRAALLLPLVRGAEMVFVDIAYAERSGPQGTYVLPKAKDDLFSLAPVCAPEKILPVSKFEEIVTSLEKSYPYLKDKITILKIDVDTEKLTSAGKVHILGQVEKAGDFAVASLEDCMTKAKPTEFGAVMRIQVIRKQKSYRYDMRNKAHAMMKLEAGDIVLVPIKKVIGR